MDKPPDETPVPAGVSASDRAGGILLLLVALGLLFIGADMVTGGRLTRTKDECDEC